MNPARPSISMRFRPYMSPNRPPLINISAKAMM